MAREPLEFITSETGAVVHFTKHDSHMYVDAQKLRTRSKLVDSIAGTDATTPIILDGTFYDLAQLRTFLECLNAESLDPLGEHWYTKPHMREQAEIMLFISLHLGIVDFEDIYIDALWASVINAHMFCAYTTQGVIFDLISRFATLTSKTVGAVLQKEDIVEGLASVATSQNLASLFENRIVAQSLAGDLAVMLQKTNISSRQKLVKKKKPTYTSSFDLLWIASTVSLVVTIMFRVPMFMFGYEEQ